MTELQTTAGRPPEHARRGFAFALMAAALGPPLGFLSIFVVVEISSLPTELPSLSDIVALPGFLLFGMLWSYFLGGVPALIAAILSGVLVWRTGGIGYLHAALIGAAAAGFYILAINVSDGAIDVPSLAQTVSIFVSVGVASALACRFIAGVIGLLPPASQASGKS